MKSKIISHIHLSKSAISRGFRSNLCVVGRQENFRLRLNQSTFPPSSENDPILLKKNLSVMTAPFLRCYECLKHSTRYQKNL